MGGGGLGHGFGGFCRLRVGGVGGGARIAEKQILRFAQDDTFFLNGWVD